jgi:hypothetical protein
MAEALLVIVLGAIGLTAVYAIAWMVLQFIRSEPEE